MKHRKLLTTPEISKRMANVRLKGGKAESLLAKELWHQGIRYRKNYKALPGSPDIAITKYRLAIFVDGEFWHGYDWENRKKKLKRNRDYWINKIEENIKRDEQNNKKLIQMGWVPIHFWEKGILKNLDHCTTVILDYVRQKKEE